MTTKARKISLMAATSLMAAIMYTPTMAQELTDKKVDAKSESAKDIEAVVIVKGVRGSIKSATDRKRKSKQIVDSVDAEDVGKLPDNNVPEALAHVTGVQIDREHGEGNSVTIRGMADIQTTLNGYNTGVGDSRTLSLSDIPAELLKSVQVYKTRTADQVEGGIGGTVNVDLRRPLDLKKGLTVAGSFRNVYSNIGDTSSPYTSLLLADRFDTPIGEMGVLVNMAYTRNNYQENFIESESPGTFYDKDLASLPTSQKSIIAPYAVNYGVEKGVNVRPSLNLGWQWKVNDQLDLLVEGSYFGSKDTIQRDRLHLVTRSGNNTLSNIVLADDGQTVKSMTLTTTGSFINGGPESYYEENKSDNYTTNFEAHWHNERTQINGSLQYNWSQTSYHGILTTYRFKNATTATVDFDSDLVPGGGPYITFPGIDLNDASNYYLFDYHDESSISKSHNLTGQVDLTYRVSDNAFLRSFQAGIRYSDQYLTHNYGYRDGFPAGYSSALALSAFPTGTSLSTTSSAISGYSNLTWYHLSGASLLANSAAIRQYLTDVGAAGGADWSTELPNNDQGQSYHSNEYSAAIYGQFNYAFEYHFPIDGVIGVRAVNTWGNSLSTQFNYDANWNVVTKPVPAKGNYTDILPSLNAVVHFTPKVQLRLAYTFNVQRPSFYDLTPWVTTQAANSTVYSGNPDLKPQRETSYDASLEYYFGRGGSVSLAAYLKKPKNYIYYASSTEYVAQLGTTATVWKNRNAGDGEFQGYEFSTQSFFDFLPGIWKNFGGSANFTYLAKGEIKYPFTEEEAKIKGVFDAPNMSKYTYNLALYYDTPELSARVSYNYRAKYKLYVWSDMPEYSPYNEATSRLDAAINWTPRKFVTFSLEGTNLGNNSNRVYWGASKTLPLGIRLQARTVQLSARFRY